MKRSVHPKHRGVHWCSNQRHTQTKDFSVHLFVEDFALFWEKMSVIAVTEFHSGIKLFFIFF